MEFTASSKYVRVSPQKARLVLDLIKGRRVEDALNTLAFTKKGIAPNIHKLLRSAVENANYANSEKGADVEIDNLFVTRAVANDGPRMKRIRPAPMGRAYRVVKRTAHLTVEVTERPLKIAKVAAEGDAAAAKPRAEKPARARKTAKA